MGYYSAGPVYEERAAVMPPVAVVTSRFQAGSAPGAVAPVVITAPAVKFDLTNRYGEQITPGSVNFTLGGKRYFDRLGILYNGLNVSTGEATAAGAINYSTGEITLSDWTPGQPNALHIDALLTTVGDHTVSSVTFRIPASPLRSGSLQLLATKATGGTLNVIGGLDGTITGAGMRGVCNYETGLVAVEFGALVLAAGLELEPWYDAANVVDGHIWQPQFVFAESIRYNAVAFAYLPLDADLLGLDPVRLPQDGKVPIFRVGGYAVVGHTGTITAAVSNGQVLNCARTRLSRVRVAGADGLPIETGYTADLNAGLVTFTDVTGYAQPVTVSHRIEDMRRISDVQIDGSLQFTGRMTHDYPTGSIVSSALIAGNLKARVSALFDQYSWDKLTWADSVIGNPAPAAYNDALAPIEVTNSGALSERWAMIFTGSSTFDLVGEHVGFVGNGTINADFAPINPISGEPYFIVRALGWGVGWSVGNVVFLQTVGAIAPFACIRTVQAGETAGTDFSFSILGRGGVDRP
jgi:hypothetical protein